MMQWTGLYRIRPASFNKVEELRGMTGSIPQGDQSDHYMSRLTKLVPAEILTLFVTFKETAGDLVGYWSILCVALVVLSRAKGTSDAGLPVQWGAFSISVVSFVLWVYAIGGYFVGLKIPPEWMRTIPMLIGAWTVFVPLVYKGGE